MNQDKSTCIIILKILYLSLLGMLIFLLASIGIDDDLIWRKALRMLGGTAIVSMPVVICYLLFPGTWHDIFNFKRRPYPCQL